MILRLIRDTSHPHLYRMVDQWESEAHYRDFMGQYPEDYQTLDLEFDALTASENLVGCYTVIERYL